ncbi:MAG TPA: hypothetical protein VEA92_01020 [Candidatus Paceibacterota bacterium]|nr:hypothetical protein [Candidatus Paceibacterota bacterium]
MKKRLLTTALSIALVALPTQFVGASAVMAMEPAGQSFCPDGIESGEELARKLDASLAIDPQGSRPLEGCHANPIEFLVAFNAADRQEGLTHVNQLPAYARKLVPVEVDRTLEYQSSCIRVMSGGRRAVEMGCVTRSLRRGEVIYMNPDTQTKVLWSGCANPGFAPSLELIVVGRECIRIRVPPLPVGTVARGGYIGPRLLPGRCHALRLPGAEDRIFDLPEECPMGVREREGRLVPIVCDWTAVERNTSRIMGQPVQIQNVSFSFVVRETDGFDWYLPPEAVEGHAALCFELPNGDIVTFSVSERNYVDGEYVVTEADIRNNTHDIG